MFSRLPDQLLAQSFGGRGLADVSIGRKKRPIDNHQILLEMCGFLKFLKLGCG